MAITMDILPTFARLANLDVPQDRIIDGKDIWPMLLGNVTATSPHEAFYYYQMGQLQAIRSGKWKLHLPLENKIRNWGKGLGKVDLKLYDLNSDIKEKTDITAQYPKVVKRLLKLAKKAREDLGDLDRNGKFQRDAGLVINPKPLTISRSQ
jgi:arylsulfatase A-like enzyme